MLTDAVCILGDVNINLLKDDDNKVACYREFLNEIGFAQLISESTRKGSLIDHILVSNDDMVSSSGIRESNCSDHDLVYCVLTFSVSTLEPTYISYRDYKRIRRDDFINDFENLGLEIIYYTENIEDKIEILRSSLILLLDAHAPLKSVNISGPRRPWITENIRFMIKLRDRARAKFKKTLSESDWQYYKGLRNYIKGAN